MAVLSRACVVIILSVVFSPSISAAQGIEGGLHGGVTFSNLPNLRNAIDFGGPVDLKHRTGVVVGPFVAFPINQTVAFQVEALYAMKGATPTDGTNELQLRLGYLDFPLLLRVATPATQRFFFLAGPSFNVNVSATAIDVIPSRTKENVSDRIHDAELGLVLGGGAAFGAFLVEGRYSAGLTNIADDPQLTASLKNRAFAILVGARF